MRTPTSSKAHNESTTGLIFLLLYRFRSLSITPLIRPPRFCLKSRFNRENPAMTLFSSYSLIGFTFSTCHHWKSIHNSMVRKTFFKTCTGKFTSKLCVQMWWITPLPGLKQQPREAARIWFKDEERKCAADWQAEITHKLVLEEVRVWEGWYTSGFLRGCGRKEFGFPSPLCSPAISWQPLKCPDVHCLSAASYFTSIIMFMTLEHTS